MGRNFTQYKQLFKRVESCGLSLKIGSNSEPGGQVDHVFKCEKKFYFPLLFLP